MSYGPNDGRQMGHKIRNITRDQFSHLSRVHQLVVEKLVEKGTWKIIEHDSRKNSPGLIEVKR